MVLGWLVDLLIDDDESERIAAALWRKKSLFKDELSRQLNKRGMRLYSKRSYERAARFFEIASSIDHENELAIYNRACDAGLQRDAPTAVFWLWKLSTISYMYGSSGSPDGDKILS